MLKEILRRVGSFKSGPRRDGKLRRVEKVKRLRNLMLRDFLKLFLFLFLSSVAIFTFLMHTILLPHFSSLEKTVRKITTLLESTVRNLDEFALNAERGVSAYVAEQVDTLRINLVSILSEFGRGQWITDCPLYPTDVSTISQLPFKIERRADTSELSQQTSKVAPKELISKHLRGCISVDLMQLDEEVYLTGKFSNSFKPDEVLLFSLNETERVRRFLIPKLIEAELLFKEELEQLLNAFAGYGGTAGSSMTSNAPITLDRIENLNQTVDWVALPSVSEPTVKIIISFLGQSYTWTVNSINPGVLEKIRELEMWLGNKADLPSAVLKFVSYLQKLEGASVDHRIEKLESSIGHGGASTDTDANAIPGKIQVRYSVNKESKTCGFSMLISTSDSVHTVTYEEKFRLIEYLERFKSKVSGALKDLSEAISGALGNVLDIKVTSRHFVTDHSSGVEFEMPFLKPIDVIPSKEHSGKAILILRFNSYMMVLTYDPMNEFLRKLEKAFEAKLEEASGSGGGQQTDVWEISDYVLMERAIAESFPENPILYSRIEKSTENVDQQEPFSKIAYGVINDEEIFIDWKIGNLLYTIRYNPSYSLILALERLTDSFGTGSVSYVLETNKFLSSKYVTDFNLREISPKDAPLYLRSPISREYDYFLRFSGAPDMTCEIFIKAKDRYLYVSFSEMRRIERLCNLSVELANKEYQQLMKNLSEYLRTRFGVEHLQQADEVLGFTEDQIKGGGETHWAVVVENDENMVVKVLVDVFAQRSYFLVTKRPFDFLKNELKSIFEDLGAVENMYIFSEQSLRKGEPKPLFAIKDLNRVELAEAISILKRSMRENRYIVEIVRFGNTGLPRFISVAVPIHVRGFKKLYLYTRYETNVLMLTVAGGGLVLVNVLAMVVLFLLTKRHAESISKPFEALTKSMEEFAESKIFEPEKLPKSNVLEVQKLVQYYSSMAEELAGNIEELRATNEELEDSYRLIEELSKEIEDAYMRFAEQLAVIAESYDESTGNHIERVGELSYFVARKLGLEPDIAEKIRKFAPLHDIGKILIPKEILDKPGKLTDEEFELMKKHTIFGGKIIGEKEYFRIARNIALYHHEKYDGSGYPYGLKGDEIPTEAQIVSIVDVYDALRSERPYKRAMSHEEAISVILNGDNRTKPSHFSPDVLEIFEKHSDEIRMIWEDVSKRTTLKRLYE